MSTDLSPRAAPEDDEQRLDGCAGPVPMDIASPTSVASSGGAESPTRQPVAESETSSSAAAATTPPAPLELPVHPPTAATAAPMGLVPPPAMALPPPPPPPPAAALAKVPVPPVKKTGKVVKLGDQILKSRPEVKAEFAAIDAHAHTQQSLTVTARMRLLDAVRLHMPTPQERSRLAIPDSLERLSIHLAYHVMLLCGGSRGVRFSTHDMMAITSLTSSLGQIFTALERTFGRLSNNARKLLMNAPANTHVRRRSSVSQVPGEAHAVSSPSPAAQAAPAVPAVPAPTAAATPVVATATSSEAMALSPTSNIDKLREELLAEAARAIEAANAPELLEELPDIVEFHHRAEQYTEKIAELQGLARRKHAELAERDEGVSEEESKEESAVIDKDPDAAKGATMPEWLETLVKKYTDQYTKAKFGGIDSIGRFASFLAACVNGDVLITAAEGRALQTLIHASEDGQTLGWFAAHPMPAGGSPRIHRRASSFSVQLPAKPRKYWSRRFFDFLRKMAELKSVPKGENQLEAFNEFV